MAHFFDPSDPFGVHYGTEPGSRIGHLPLGGTLLIGLWAGDPSLMARLNPVADDPTRVSIRSGAAGFADKADVRFYTLIGLTDDDRKIITIAARLDGDHGPIWAQMQVYIMSIAGDPLPDIGLDADCRKDGYYLDNITGAHYSRLDNGLFWVDHWRGPEVVLDFRAIKRTSDMASIYVYYRDLRDRIIHPRVMDKYTCPNIFYCVKDIDDALPMAEANQELIMLAGETIALTGLGFRPRMSPPKRPSAARPMSNAAIKRITPKVGGAIPLEEAAEVAVVSQPPARNGLRVLVVGPESEAEFQYALKVNDSGGKAVTVNPFRSGAADEFIKAGGEFVEGKIESLPQDAKFDIIREDFPYPTEWLDVPAAAARISRTKPGGTWVVVTEREGFATALEASAKLQGAKVNRYEITALDHWATPQSPHATRDASSRYILLVSP
ncbi:hypothetical protein JQ615_35690 [Bradyrhizobium jicamae]|uniref:Uncharacterized protein n=1 Tax=Bradyrhizobium jicamae TaxID=280332 RepID=A0ABS5FV51_9BRAD|nr:hypothetical protein [Bradyrhizobium jicamae]MBR0800718.1 hypothetical protein [Bradyrhizobium jicamae]MBR0936614.1 hypothetical protein [Bradyrhizobium jicamae]